MGLVLNTVIILCILGLVGALVLYVTAKQFQVQEDPRIDEIEALLPGANCGACGCKGCRDFAVTCTGAGNLDGLRCPGAAPGAMEKIAAILGVSPSADGMRSIAVLRCNGTCSARALIYIYDGARTCAVMDAAGVGTRGCSYGCLGCGDCVEVCNFDAIHLDKESGLPVVDADACTGCGACVRECPRTILELRPAGRRDRRVWVACSSRDKGALARKICTNACIGCGKCASVCPFGAITVSDNLAYIDPDLCESCGKCIPVCPTGAIHATFTPPVPASKASES